MKRCILCKSRENDDVLYGELLQKDDVCVHFNCLYLTTCLVQDVNEDAVVPNLYGFTLNSIRREAKKCKKNYCCFCKKKYANVVCCKTKCRKYFHMVCGVKNDALFEFCETYRSFCKRHGKYFKKKPDSNENCCICLDKLNNSIYGKITRSNVLKSPCCRNGWFHKYCLQKYAKTSGYFFKCPLCNDANIFREKIAKLGIFILDRDADWELESNAYHDLMERPYICTAENCQNELGREDMTNSTLIFCGGCGHKAIHEACLTMETELYICKECDDIFANHNLNRTNNVEPPHSVEVVEEEEENSFVDVETLNDEEKSYSVQFIAEYSMRDSEDESIISNNKHVRRKRLRLLSDASQSTTSTAETETPLAKLLRKKRSLCFPESPESSTPTRDTPEESDGEIPIAKSSQVLPDSPSSNPSTVMQESEDELAIINHCLLPRKPINIITDTPEIEKENQQLNESLQESTEEDTPNCLARRTRQSKAKNESACSDSEHKSKNLLNISCIARRTRRRLSLLSEDDTDKSECKVLIRRISGAKRRALSNRQSNLQVIEISDESDFNVQTPRSAKKVVQKRRSKRRRVGGDDSEEEIKSLNRKRSACKELNSDCLAKRTRRQAETKSNIIVRRTKLTIISSSSE